MTSIRFEAPSSKASQQPPLTSCAYSRVSKPKKSASYRSSSRCSFSCSSSTPARRQLRGRRRGFRSAARCALLFQENFSGDSPHSETLRHVGAEGVVASTRHVTSSGDARSASRLEWLRASACRRSAPFLNQGLVKDPDGVRNYLFSLGEDCLPPLVDMLETLELPPNRSAWSATSSPNSANNHVPLCSPRASTIRRQTS